ncbi:MAG: hypothetical protein NTU94_18460 [Planctomycetota bacterium]|nr:hypothetical protein [Planctomycetota bacterium]
MQIHPAGDLHHEVHRVELLNLAGGVLELDARLGIDAQGRLAGLLLGLFVDPDAAVAGGELLLGRHDREAVAHEDHLHAGRLVPLVDEAAGHLDHRRRRQRLLAIGGGDGRGGRLLAGGRGRGSGRR